MRQLRTLIALLSFVCFAVSPSSAQNSFPSKPITMLVPFGAGGALDLIARVLADGLRQEWGQTVLVDNKPGASGLLAMRLAAGAAPDGYTIILSSESNHILLPLLDSKFPMDVTKEFVPISLSGQFQHTLIVKKELPVSSVKELVEYLRANPGKLSFGSSGVGTQAHIAGEYLSLLTQSKMVHVPYRSSPAALNDLLAGNLDINFQSMPAVRSYVDSSRLKMLAVLSSERLKELPNMPTMAETGFPDFVLSSWMGIFAPAGVPSDIRRQLSEALVKVGKNPELQARIRGAGIEPVGSDSQTFARFVEAEGKKWKTFIDRTGIKLNP
jgi:tripartite-type tricarboxylate transporter receptor subunit TctC